MNETHFNFFLLTAEMAQIIKDLQKYVPIYSVNGHYVLQPINVEYHNSFILPPGWEKLTINCMKYYNIITATLTMM